MNTQDDHKLADLAKLLGVVATAAAIAVVGIGCGDDGETAIETGAQTETGAATTGASTTSGDCPDVPFHDSTITAIRSSVDCAAATALATDVLGRDDCVEESPAGVNTCESLGYQCATTIEPAEGIIFDTKCSAGADRVSFQQMVPKS